MNQRLLVNDSSKISFNQKCINSRCSRRFTYLPSFESDARMKTNVVKQSGIHEGKCKIRHTAQLDATIDLQINRIICTIFKQCQRAVTIDFGNSRSPEFQQRRLRPFYLL